MYMKHFAIYMKLIYFKLTLLQVKKLMISWEFPGSPAVRTWCSLYKGTGLIPDRGSEIQHAAHTHAHTHMIKNKVWGQISHLWFLEWKCSLPKHSQSRVELGPKTSSKFVSEEAMEEG